MTEAEFKNKTTTQKTNWIAFKCSECNSLSALDAKYPDGRTCPICGGGPLIPLGYSNSKSKHIQHEADEQRALFDWVAFARARYPDIDLIYHIPNGGSRNKIEAANLKHQGVRPGVPDLCLPVARGGYHGLYIELKSGNNKPTQKQTEWIQALRLQGYAAEVCHGWEQAAKTIIDYITSK